MHALSGEVSVSFFAVAVRAECLYGVETVVCVGAEVVCFQSFACWAVVAAHLAGVVVSGEGCLSPLLPVGGEGGSSPGHPGGRTLVIVTGPSMRTGSMTTVNPGIRWISGPSSSSSHGHSTPSMVTERSSKSM